MPKKSNLHRKLVQLDHRYSWHPFTQMQDWIQQEPIVIQSARGSILKDSLGRTYLDANSSIWTNLHGHGHPKINAAIRKQLGRISHSSYLGLANEPASHLAERLVRLANPKSVKGEPPISRVFFSDDGSTAVEAALKMAHGYLCREKETSQPRFASMRNAYHGDTLGAVSVGHIPLFHSTYKSLLFKSESIPSPYCYRCPFNRAKPERADARVYRKCNWECVGEVAGVFEKAKSNSRPIHALLVEPLMQGAAGMIPQPSGWLKQVAEIVRGHKAVLIADEVMTAFGRASEPTTPARAKSTALLACHQEGVQPDLAAVAKGLTGGYLPMAATLAGDHLFRAFLGRYEEFRTFFHGHSFTANALGSAAALANLELLESAACTKARREIIAGLDAHLPKLWKIGKVGDVRRVGAVAGIELVRDWRTRDPFPIEEQAGIRVCAAMAKKGVITRPIGNVIVMMPPYSTSAAQIERMVHALERSIQEVHGGRLV